MKIELEKPKSLDDLKENLIYQTFRNLNFINIQYFETIYLSEKYNFHDYKEKTIKELKKFLKAIEGIK